MDKLEMKVLELSKQEDIIRICIQILSKCLMVFWSHKLTGTNKIDMKEI